MGFDTTRWETPLEWERYAKYIEELANLDGGNLSLGWEIKTPREIPEFTTLCIKHCHVHVGKEKMLTDLIRRLQRDDKSSNLII